MLVLVIWKISSKVGIFSSDQDQTIQSGQTVQTTQTKIVCSLNFIEEIFNIKSCSLVIAMILFRSDCRKVIR